MTTQHELRAVLRQQLASFIQRTFHTVVPGEPYADNWHVWSMAWHLEQCARGRIRRLIITIPPRHLKSISVSVAFPAWLLGHDPTRKIVCVSYAQELGVKHALDSRAVMESRWYRGCFPHTRIHPEKNTQSEIMTTRRGYRLTTSVGGTLTGRGGNLILLDDPHKAEEAQSETKREAVINWYRNTLLSCLDSKGGDVIVLVQQRLHEGDLAGHLLESGQWTHLDIPAIAEEEQKIPVADGRLHVRQAGDVLHGAREPQAVLEAIRRDIGTYAFAAQYQQRPAPLGGGLVQWRWFRTYIKAPLKEYGDWIAQSWDTASKADSSNDWTVCTTWLIKNHHYYLLDVFRERLEFPALKKRIVSLAGGWAADQVLIEDKGAGTALIQDLRRDSALAIIGIIPKDDKPTRMMAVSPLIEGGRVTVPTEAPWLADFQREVVHFPKGKHDDQVDSLSQFLNWARDHQSSWEIFTTPSMFASEFEDLLGSRPGIDPL